MTSPSSPAPAASVSPARLSLQLYTLRGPLADDLDATLAQVAGFGYAQVEPYQLLAFADRLGPALDQYALTAPTAHAALLTGDQDATFAAAQQLGVTTVIEPHVPEARWQSEEDIRQVAAELNAAAEKAAGLGLRVGYHNHSHELRSMVGGRHALEVAVQHLSPEVVLEVDTYWAYAGGADVVALLHRLGDRVVALHVKDGDGTLDTKRQVAVGAGSLPVWDYLAAAPHALAVVELDDSEDDLLTAVGDSRAYLVGEGA